MGTDDKSMLTWRM